MVHIYYARAHELRDAIGDLLHGKQGRFFSHIDSPRTGYRHADLPKRLFALTDGVGDIGVHGAAPEV